MKIEMKIRIVDDEGNAFIGPGPVDLLKRIRRLGSINRAAAEMGMSLTKAVRIVRDLREKTGQAFVESAIGGPGGGGSRLTSFGDQLVERWQELADDVESHARKRFLEIGLLAVLPRSRGWMKR